MSRMHGRKTVAWALVLLAGSPLSAQAQPARAQATGEQPASNPPAKGPPTGEPPVLNRTFGRTGPKGGAADGNGGSGRIFHGFGGGTDVDLRGGDGGDAPEPVELTFWIWTSGTRAEMPDFEDGIWRDPRVHPLIQVHAEYPDEPGRNAPNVGGKGIGTNYELRDSWDGKNPEAVAEMMAGWVNWFQEQYGQHGRGDLRYAMWLNGWGNVSHDRDWMHNPRNAWVLGRNPADALDAPISDQARVGSFYSAEGVRLNAEWSGRFVGHLDSELARMELPEPEALHLDLEGVFDLNKIAEWWVPALDDPRARTERIDGRSTLSELAREAPQFWPESGTHARRNRPFVSWASGVAMGAIDHVLWEGMGRQARERWPEVKLSNFQLTPGTDAVPFKFEKIDMEYTDAEIRHMSHAAPTIYWLNDWAFENGNVSIADHLARYGGSATGDARHDLNELNALVGMHRIDACIDNGMPVVAWVRPPNPDKLDLERTARVIRHGASRGVTEWILWTGEAYDWKILIDEVDRQNNEYAMEGR